ncbi:MULTISPECIES: zeta toxin family protein [unclassified Streptomyces]|uniref:zeta toxin family protein n=1 Tax=unclassified Streptomyces TaxID=2593676 RepID=UPI0033E45071
MPDVDEFQLSGSTLTELFATRVRPFIFRGYEAQAHPTYALVGAQQGAGKSQAIAARRQRSDGRHLVPLGPDDLRPFHPQYERLMRTAPALMKDATVQATSAWVAMARQHAITHRYSLLAESTFKEPRVILTTAREFAANGYTVEVTALAVREERSRLDTLNRYLPAADAMPGRWVTPSRHDQAYAMIPAFLAAAENDHAVHQIQITNRSADPLYDNVRASDGQWLREPSAAAVLHQERAKPFIHEEARGWLELHHDVVLNFAAAGQVNTHTHDVLQQVLIDGQTIETMTTGGQRPEVRAALRHVVSGQLKAEPWSIETSVGFLSARATLDHVFAASHPAQLTAIDAVSAGRLHKGAVDQYSTVRLAARAFPLTAGQATSVPQPDEPQSGHGSFPDEPRRHPGLER